MCTKRWQKFERNRREQENEQMLRAEHWSVSQQQQPVLLLFCPFGRRFFFFWLFLSLGNPKGQTQREREREKGENLRLGRKKRRVSVSSTKREESRRKRISRDFILNFHLFSFFLNKKKFSPSATHVQSPGHWLTEFSLQKNFKSISAPFFFLNWKFVWRHSLRTQFHQKIIPKIRKKKISDRFVVPVINFGETTGTRPGLWTFLSNATRERESHQKFAVCNTSQFSFCLCCYPFVLAPPFFSSSSLAPSPFIHSSLF